MIFNPQTYALPDIAGEPFIDADELDQLLQKHARPTRQHIEQIIARSASRQRLDLDDVATLLNAASEDRASVLEAAHRLKEEVYGNRIVLFAPLYVGNNCTNRCAYCTFRADNRDALRKTLSHDELTAEVTALERSGHKRLILVYGESPLYSAEYIASTVRTVYGVRTPEGSGEIRRVNINAAPMSVEDFRTVHQAGIGTYQIFQETYHPLTYSKYHLGGKKADYNWRLTALDRAMQAGIDDVGLGALLGLHHWRYEIMGLVRHTNHLEACFGVGPHTISFPRITEAEGSLAAAAPVGDDDFVYAIAVLRLAVPYTGLILTAREPAALRDAAIRYGVSQIDGGTKLEIGSYAADEQNQGSSQFAINDNRSLAAVIQELIEGDYLPSFCTACYRKGRTGEHFMEFSVPGFIKRFCTPNALLTLAEYLCDYADEQTATRGWALIDRTLEHKVDPVRVDELRQRIEQIKGGARDLYY